MTGPRAIEFVEDYPHNLRDFDGRFASEEACIAYLVSLRWPQGFVCSKCGGRSQRVLGLGSYETAWLWLHKLRPAMVRSGRDFLTGCVEVDEIYVGGTEDGVHGRETHEKSIVAIAVEVYSPKGFGRQVGQMGLSGYPVLPIGGSGLEIFRHS